MSPNRPTNSGALSEVAAELERERAVWRVTLLAAIRPITAMVGLIGLLAFTFMMQFPQQLLPLTGLSVLLLASILPGLGSRLRTWLILLSLAGTCILTLAFHGLAPNLFVGTLVAVAFTLLLLERRDALVACAIVGLGIAAAGVKLIFSRTATPPVLSAMIDVTHPTNVIRILITFFLIAMLLVLGMNHVLRSFERLFREKSAALASLRAETAEKEGLRLELAMREKAVARARELEFLGRLASYFGHDTNNALFVAWSCLDVLKDPMAPPEEKGDALSTLAAAVNHIRDIASQMRAFGPGRKASPGSADLTAVLQGATGMLRRILPSGVCISLGDIPPVRVEMEAAELQRILTNLALNASDAMRDKGTLAIGARVVLADELEHLGLARKNVVALHVADTGTGIPAAVKERMFEPFFTTKGTRGSGLGLASVKESVEACGGAVKVDSKLGQGTTFALFLPIMAAESVDRERTHEVAVNPGAILVVDEPLVQAAIVRALQSLCLTALGATSAAHGSDLLRSMTEPISLLVVGDVSGSDFRELACSLHQKFANARIICCVDENIQEEGIGMPVTCLFKPFTLPELLKVVERELALVAKTAARATRQDRRS